MNDLFITIEEASKRAGTSKETMRTIVASGLIPGAQRFKKKYSKRYTYLINKNQFENWMKGETNGEINL